MSVGVSSRANFFREQAKEIVWKPGGLHMNIPVKHNITNNLNAGSPIIFEFPYINKGAYNFSSSYLKFKLRIRTVAGGAPNADTVYGVNGMGHCVWKKMELTANGVSVGNSFQPYSYKKMIEHLLTNNTTNEYSDELWGYKKRVNVANNDLDMDTMRGQPHFSLGNPDMIGDWQEFLIYPNLDIFQSDTNIVSLDTVNWQLRLTPHDSIHCLNWSCNRGNAMDEVDNTNLAASIATNYKVEIEPESIKFFLRVDKFTDSAYLAAMNAARDHGFVYNYTPTSIKTKVLSQGQNSIEDSDLTPRANPVMYAHTFVCHDGYEGSKERNPYLFRPPPQLRRIYNYFNGSIVGEQNPIDFTDEGLKQLYVNNNNALEIDQYAKGLSYSSSELGRGMFFKIVSLAPSSDSMDLQPLVTEGTHQYRVELNANADNDYTFITYIRYETAQLIINLDGTVHNTFMI